MISDPMKSDQFTFTNADISGTMMQNECPRPAECDPSTPYRTPDGTCNNLGNPKIGMANLPLRRLIPNRYDDGEISKAFEIFPGPTAGSLGYFFNIP